MYSIYWEFIRFYFSSKTDHGLHSPFAYKFYQNVIKPKPSQELKFGYRNLLNGLLKRKDYIEVFDFGAGSKKRNERYRRVRDIAKFSTKSLKCYKFIHHYIAVYKPSTILELGTSLGLSTALIHKANPTAYIVSIEGCPNTLEVAKEHLDASIITINGNIDALLPEILMESKNFDFVFIDANHTFEATLHYFQTLLPYTNISTCIVFDDIYWSEGMNKAWKTIKSHPKVIQTIDIFEMGFVFFDSKQSKQDFKLR